MDSLLRAIEGNRPGSLKDSLKMTHFNEPLFDLLAEPLNYALRQPGISPEIIQILLETGASTEGAPHGALWTALQNHQPLAIIKLLLEFKADLYRLVPLQPEADEKEPHVEYSFLHLCLYLGRLDLFPLLSKELIEDQRNLFKETPLSKLGIGKIIYFF